MRFIGLLSVVILILFGIIGCNRGILTRDGDDGVVYLKGEACVINYTEDRVLYRARLTFCEYQQTLETWDKEVQAKNDL